MHSLANTIREINPGLMLAHCLGIKSLLFLLAIHSLHTVYAINSALFLLASPSFNVGPLSTALIQLCFCWPFLRGVYFGVVYQWGICRLIFRPVQVDMDFPFHSCITWSIRHAVHALITRLDHLDNMPCSGRLRITCQALSDYDRSLKMTLEMTPGDDPWRWPLLEIHIGILTLKALKYFYVNHDTKGYFSIWRHYKCLSQLFPLHFNT